MGKTAEKVEKVEEVVATTKRPSMGMNALLNSTKKGDKLAGILRMFSEVEIVRGADKSTAANKCSKAGFSLRDLSTEAVDKDEKLVAVMKVVSTEFGSLKDCMTDKDATLSEEMQEAHLTLLSYGKQTKVSGLPTEMVF